MQIRRQLIRHRRGAAQVAANPPVFTAPPSLTTTPTVGSPCTFTIGTYTGTLPITVTTRFVLDDVEVGEVNDSEYTPTVAGGSLKPRVTLSNSAGSVTVDGAAVTVIDTPVVAPPTTDTGADADIGLTHDPADSTLWDAEVSYSRHTFVHDGSGNKFLCLGAFEANTLHMIDVPAGTPLTNETYWRSIPIWYYIDDEIGSDSYTGTSKTVDGGGVGPWATTLKVTQKCSAASGETAAAPGSWFCFKRGRTFPGCLHANIASSPIGAHARFGYSTYGVGPRPHIEFRDHVAAPKAMITWTQREGGMIFLELVFDGLKTFKATLASGSTLVEGDEVTGQTSGATGIVHQIVTATNMIIRPTLASGGFVNEAIQTAGATRSATITARAYVTGINLAVANSNAIGCEVRNTSANGVAVGGGVGKPGSGNGIVLWNSIIEDCAKITTNGAGVDGGDGGPLIGKNTLRRNGHGTRAHNLYLHRLTGARIRRNLSQGAEASGLVLHGLSTDFEVTDNDFLENGIGIDISGAYGDGANPTFESFTRAYIARNRMRLGKNPLLYFSSMIDSIVECNLIYGNILNVSLAQVDLRTTDDVGVSNLVFRNNTLVNYTKVMNINGTLYEGWKAYNNILVTSSATSEVLTKTSALTPSAEIDLDYNTYWMSAQAESAGIISWEGARYTLDSFRTLTSKETNGTYGDPLFTDAANGDYTLQAGSPCKGTGKPLSEMLDINGNPLTQMYDLNGDLFNAATPSRGCFV